MHHIANYRQLANYRQQIAAGEIVTEIDLSYQNLSSEDLEPLFTDLDNNPAIKEGLIKLNLYMNRISTLTLRGYKSLKDLDLRYNKLIKIPTLIDFDSLEILDFHGNTFSQAFLPADMCPKLQFLGLGKTCLRNLPILNIDTHLHLRQVDLAQNYLPALCNSILEEENRLINPQFQLSISSARGWTSQRLEGNRDNRTDEQENLYCVGEDANTVRKLMIKDMQRILVFIRQASKQHGLPNPNELNAMLLTFLIGEIDSIGETMRKLQTYFPERSAAIANYMSGTEYRELSEQHEEQFKQFVDSTQKKTKQWEKAIELHRAIRKFIPQQYIKLTYDLTAPLRKHAIMGEQSQSSLWPLAVLLTSCILYLLYNNVNLETDNTIAQTHKLKL